MASVQEYMRIVQEYSAMYGVNPAWINALIQTESSWNPEAKNPDSSATGLGQFTKDTRAEWIAKGFPDPWNKDNPRGQIQTIVAYFADLLKRHGNYPSAMDAYKGANVGKYGVQNAASSKEAARIAETPGYRFGTFGNTAYGQSGENPDPTMRGDMTGRMQAGFPGMYENGVFSVYKFLSPELILSIFALVLGAVSIYQVSK